MKRLYQIIGAVLALAVLGYFGYYTHKAFDPASLARLVRPRAIAAISVAALLYGVIIPTSAWAWRRLLSDISGEWSWSLLVGIMGSTQVAKYLPGNIAQHATRTALSLAKGMRLGDFVMSVTVEIVLVLLSASVVGTVCLLASPLAFSAFPDHLVISVLVLFFTLVLMLPVLPRILNWAARVVAEKRGVNGGQWTPAIPGSQSQLMAFSAYASNYLLIGLGFFLIARAVGIAEDIGYAQLTAAFALSWLAGFLAPGMPAGLGVREGVMALILSGSSTSPNILSAVLAMRISTMAGDAGWFLVGSFLLVRAKPRSSHE